MTLETKREILVLLLDLLQDVKTIEELRAKVLVAYANELPQWDGTSDDKA